MILVAYLLFKYYGTYQLIGKFRSGSFLAAAFVGFFLLIGIRGVSKDLGTVFLSRSTIIPYLDAVLISLTARPCKRETLSRGQSNIVVA